MPQNIIILLFIRQYILEFKTQQPQPRRNATISYWLVIANNILKQFMSHVFDPKYAQ